MKYDVMIIGGSFAGLSAALPLARARKKVLVVDAGLRRNRFAAHSHNFLTQDGQEPSAIIAVAKQQLEKYSSITWLNASVIDVQAMNDDYEVFTEDENNKRDLFQAEKLIIAAGVKDDLPEIEGLTERWGKSVFHCPYCDGYELNLGQLGMLYSGSHSLHMALMLPDWGNTTLFLNAAVSIDTIEPAILEQLNQRHVKLDTRKIAKIENHCDLKFENGDQTQLDGLFVSTFMRINSPWIRKLGLDIDRNEYSEAILTNATKQTNLKNIYACGDITRSGGSVAFSVADGAMAGVAAHKSFVFGG
ncbi:NAD(P)/FAD-dependent oxidoreductase [Acinetobacter bereziniae]|uniref:NAD(P)/FAD-dependent oxidoreductase n=1 Tax=Acinetobacter bereziniae TaxID=106648 RepID=UPI001902BC9E|nr:NAD(P)/FAD-dependent oxidoreductase [Acinetobacter bereziniae]MBJ8554263.1 NAD(P)/FAD-dependent oxidoreductase [Acinetobacter bereziniae]